MSIHCYNVRESSEDVKAHYNYFRDYNPSTGRYQRSDPIGLWGGPKTYGYAGANPLWFSDYLCLAPKIPNGLVPGGI